MSQTSLPDTPTPPDARLITLDILRGIALLGIFMVNMLFFSGPYGYFGINAAQNAGEKWLEAFVRVFAQGSFYSLFSFLFGLGLALQLRRGPVALPRFRRRVLVLLGIGLVHAIFIWYGDILVTYAVAGFVLTLFAFRRSWILVLGALVFFVLSSLTYLTPLHFGFARYAPWLTLESFNGVMGTGSYAELVAYQARMAWREILNLPNFMPTVLWLFLLGLLAGQKGLFNRPHRRVWLTILVVALPIALFFKGYVAYWFWTDTYSPLTVGYSFGIGGPALMFVYLALLSLLLAHTIWQRRLAFFGATGRMALTNYLSQSLLCTLMFNGYGLGLYGKLGLSVTLPVVLGIYALQALFSHFWLRHFRFGPAEWLWRSLTYGAWQPLRLPG